MDSYGQSTITGALRGHAWKPASFCGPNGGNCVEVNLGTRGLAGLRDGKRISGPALVLRYPEWATFLRAIKYERFRRA
jgi:hypothetical protein